ALLAMDHAARHEPGRTEKLGGFDHLAGGERGAHRAGGDRTALVLERRHDVDGKALLLALRGEKARRAGAVLAEMKIEADGGAADAEPLDQHVADEILGRGAGEPRIEAHDDRAGETGRGQEPQL